MRFLNRNLLTDVLNPFKKLEDTSKDYIKVLCEDTHGKFINHVKTYRGNKLKTDDKIFSGEVFSGEEGVEIGLADEVGSMVKVLDEKYPGAKLNFPPRDNSFQARIRNLL